MQLLGKSDKTIAKSMKRLDDVGLINRETRFNRKIGKRNRRIKLVKKATEVVHAPMEIYLLEITDGAKMLLIQLVGLSKQEGHVYATNKALAAKMNVSKRMVYRYLNELIEYKLISIENAGTLHRIIYVTEELIMNELTLEEDQRLIDCVEDWKVYINKTISLIGIKHDIYEKQP